MENITIEVNNISKSFKDKQILMDVKLECKGGNIYGIVGYNGSGKTVLFKCICGFYRVDQGNVLVNGQVMGKDIDMLTSAGIIIEEPGYIRNFSGYKNLEFLYRIRNRKSREIIESAMKSVGLDPASKKKVENYSLGMRQRLAIAQATMEEQKILILDEPMNGLDRDGVEQMREYFENLKKQGRLIILASHNREDIEILCDEVYEMDHGLLKRVK